MSEGFNILQPQQELDLLDFQTPTASTPVVPAAAPAVTTPTPSGMRAFGDVDATRKSIYDSIYNSVSKLKPVSNQTHTLRLRNVQWSDPENYSKAERKKAILSGGTLGRRLRGTWDLLDNASGKVLDSRDATILRAPYLTEGGTFVNGGNEYALKNQQRLRSGIFVREKENGELEAHCNVLENGPIHRYFLDPAKGVFYVKMGQSQIPLLPLMHAMGATDKELNEVWGRDIVAANAAKADASAIGKLKEKVLKKPAEGPLEPQIRAAFEAMTLDPEVTGRTLGKPFTRIDKDTLLATTAKLLAVHRKTADVDDRDHLAFQQFVGPEDLFSERLLKDRAGLQRQLLFKMSGKGNLKSLPTGALQPQIDSALLDSGLGQAIEEINPLEILDKNTQITRMGEGGIASYDAIPDESRSVQPSQLGFVDPVRTPESMRAGVDVYLARNARKGPDGKLYGEFRDVKTGQQVWKTPQEIADVAVGFPGVLRLPQRRVPAMQNGRLTYVPKERIAYEVPPFENAFSPTANLLPFKSMLKGQRMAMGSRMLTQALPLVKPEAQLVQTAIPGTNGQRSYAEEYAKHAGAIFADKPGKVVSVKPDAIQVKYDDGTADTIELHQNLPYNRKVGLSQTAMIQAGQRFDAGSLMAKSNFTDDKGTLALGLNARVAYMPWGGSVFEDAVVISESMAKRLTSEHMYQHQLEKTDRTRYGKKSYVSLFPARYDRKTLEKLDDDGVIQPGTEVSYGDPLILGAEERSRALNKIHKKGQAGFQDVSVTWEHHDPGIVTDVIAGKNGPVVVVKSQHPMQVGDKLSGGYGDKGTVSAIVPDGQMPHDDKGTPFEVLMSPLGLITRTNPAQVAEAALGKIAAKTGKAIKIEDFDPAVTDRIAWTIQQLQQHGLSDTEEVHDPMTNTRVPNVFTGMRYLMKLHHTSESKGQGRSGGAYTADETPAKGGTSGCFAPKQKVMTHLGPMHIAEICEKRLGVNVRTFSESLQEWVYRPVTDWFVYRSPVDQLISVNTVSGLCEVESRTNKTRAAMYLTRNHEVFTYDRGKVQAGELTVADRLVTYGPVPTEDQLAFIYGTMLGDGSAQEHEVRFEHSVKQQEFVAWKKSILAGLCPNQCDCVHDHTEKDNRVAATMRNKRIRSRVVWVGQDHVTSEVRRICYPGGVKTITQDWLSKLTDLSLAVWVLDDGSITSRAKKKGRINFSGNIATMGFDRQSLELLCRWLNARLGTACSINCIGSIVLPADACRKLISIIARYVPAAAIPRSKRFLRRQVTALQRQTAPVRLQTACRIGKVPLRISKIEPYRHDKPGVPEINVYDFTVADTHTYVAGHALVSNSKRISMLDVNALLSHGAVNVLRDAGAIRGQKNEEYWLQFMQGHTPRPPRVPLVYRKFVDEFKAAGINVLRNGSQLNIMAMTDKDVDALAGNRELKHGKTVEFGEDLKPIEGGLFDPKLTGGHHGGQWSAIPLHEPMPNPVMEEPIRRVLGLTQSKFEDVLAGREQLNGQSGPAAIQAALKNINLPAAIAVARAQAKNGSQATRDAAVRRLGYLKSARDLGLHPSEWMLKRVPVLPPQFRPVNLMSGNKQVPLVADANHLYKELIEANDNLTEMGKLSSDTGDERLAVYHAFKAVTGLGDPITQQSQEKQVKGILKSVFGSSPKFGAIQRKLLSSTVDNVGRAVVIPDPDLDMDQLGIPEDRAFDIYRRFVVRRLRRSGMNMLEAMKQVEDKTPLARKVLLEEMDHRPVIMNRAPVLHRFGIMAFRPVLTKGSSVHVPPIVVKPFGMDFDGDAVQYHVPTDEEARKEALERMLPSRQLISPGDFKTPNYKPHMEYLAGLYHSTTAKTKRTHHFRNKDDVRKAWLAGKIDTGDAVRILEDA